MAEKKEKSIWLTVAKIIFSCLLLVSVMNGYFIAGAKSLSENMIGGTVAFLSAKSLVGADEGKK